MSQITRNNSKMPLNMVSKRSKNSRTELSTTKNNAWKICSTSKLLWLVKYVTLKLENLLKETCLVLTKKVINFKYRGHARWK